MKKVAVDKKIQVIFQGTFRHVLAGFLLERRSRGLAKGTVEYYQGELDLFSEFLDQAGITQFEEVDSETIRRYLLHLERKPPEGRGRNPGGIHAAFRAIRAIFNWYLEEFEPENWRNPMRRIKGPKVNRQGRPGVSLEAIAAMIRACTTGQAKRDRALIMTLLDTGCRASELLALDVGDLDLITGAIHIRSGKGGKARVVLAGTKTRKALRAYLKERGDLYEQDPLFAIDEGDSRLKYNGLVRLIERRAKGAGVETPGLHDFRRCFATQMLRNGVDLQRLAGMMGHNSLEVLRRYLHLVEDDLHQAHALASPVDRNL